MENSRSKKEKNPGSDSSFAFPPPVLSPPTSPARVKDPSGLFIDISASTLAVLAHMVFRLCYSFAWNFMMGLRHG